MHIFQTGDLYRENILFRLLQLKKEKVLISQISISYKVEGHVPPVKWYTEERETFCALTGTFRLGFYSVKIPITESTREFLRFYILYLYSEFRSHEYVCSFFFFNILGLERCSAFKSMKGSCRGPELNS